MTTQFKRNSECYNPMFFEHGNALKQVDKFIIFNDSGKELTSFNWLSRSQYSSNNDVPLLEIDADIKRQKSDEFKKNLCYFRPSKDTYEKTYDVYIHVSLMPYGRKVIETVDFTDYQYDRVLYQFTNTRVKKDRQLNEEAKFEVGCNVCLENRFQTDKHKLMEKLRDKLSNVDLNLSDLKKYLAFIDINKELLIQAGVI